MRTFRLAAAAATLALGACAHSPSHAPADPLEPVNRGIYSFNTTADTYVLRPVAKGYVAVVPGFMRNGVNNFFGNLTGPLAIISQLLQGKPVAATADLGRFLLNTTLGLGGLIDVAGHWGLPAHREDMGQTFGRWGVGQGWYLMLPFLGPSTNRDLLGRLVGAPLSPLYTAENSTVVWGLNVMDAIQTRAKLLNADRLLEDQLDPYVFIRSAYLQRRWSAVHDGNPPPEPGGLDDFEDFDDF